MMMKRTLERSGWRLWHLAAVAGLMLLGIAARWDAWADMLRIAQRDEESSHIFLVPMVFAWIIWVRRMRLRQCRPRGTLIGPALVLLGWVISAYGYRHAVQSFWHGGAVVVLIGCALSVLGRDVLLRFIPAFAVLAFIVPVPGMLRTQISIPLQTATATVTQGVFELFGVMVERAGNILVINGTDVEIAEACNGMRLIFALVLVSYTFAFITPLRPVVRLIILVSSPLLAILCNVIRLLPTVWMYGYGSQATAARFHDVSAWVMVIVAFLMLLGVLSLVRWAMIPVAQYNLAHD